MFCPTPEKIKSETLKSKKGFTLVEVLLVLVIISIMAGLLITVIDPVKQRARARDGTIIATANKMVAGIQAYNSAIGRYPSCYILAGSGATNEINNVDTTPANITGCTAGAPDSGSFSINGLVTPLNVCDGVFYAEGTTVGACQFRYQTDDLGTEACLGIRLNLPVNINNDAVTGQYLIWDTRSSTAPTGTPGTNAAMADNTVASCDIAP